MLILRKDAYIFVPLLFWGLVPVFSLAAAAVVAKRSLGSWALAVTLPFACLLIALTTTIVVRRQSNVLSVKTLTTRKEIALGNAVIWVDHAHQERYRVVIEGVALTGAMLRGRCRRDALRISQHLQIPTTVGGND